MISNLLRRPQSSSYKCGAASARSSVCRVRAPSSRAAVAVKAAKDPVPDAFYNRSPEVHELTKRLEDEPSSITVLTGPSNGGKSALVNKIIANAKVAGKTVSSNKRQIFLRVNCRSGDSTNPAAFASLLGEQIDSADLKVDEVDYTSWLQKHGSFVKQVQYDKAILQLQSQPATPLNILISFLRKWLAKYPGRPWPVIVIDEANRLRDWKEENEPALQGLLDFFVSITKEQGVCHVLLATSDSFLVDWLQKKGIRQNQYDVFTIGDLTEDGIKGYVYGVNGYPGLVNTTQWGEDGGFTLPESLWQTAYTRLGGNIGNWKKLTLVTSSLFEPALGKGELEANLQEAWQGALKLALAEASDRVKQGFRPAALPVVRNKPQWTRQQWSTVLRSIKEAPHHVVPIDSLEEMEVSVEAIGSLLDYNFIALRQPSLLAEDLPAEVYGDDFESKVVTAVNAAHLEYICSGRWEKVSTATSADTPKHPDSSPGPSRPSSPTSDALRDVSDKIEAVEARIEDVEGQLKKAIDTVNGVLAVKGDGWEVELFVRQQQQQQLGDALRQLRDEKKQLRQEKLVLLKADE